MKQKTFTDIEYSFRMKKTKREDFLEIMDEIIPWDEWVGSKRMTEVMEPHIPKIPRKTNLQNFSYHIVPIIQTILFR